MFNRILVLVWFAVIASPLWGQAKPASSRMANLQAGCGFTTANSDYLSHRISGGAAYFDLDFTRRLGAEGEFHFVKDAKETGVYEKTYEIGGRYHLTLSRFMPYSKLMYGRGVFNFPAYPGYRHSNLAYNLFAGGAGLDYRILPHLNGRADFEYQRWVGFPVSELAPTLLTFGVAYHL